MKVLLSIFRIRPHTPLGQQSHVSDDALACHYHRHKLGCKLLLWPQKIVSLYKKSQKNLAIFLLKHNNLYSQLLRLVKDTL